MLCHRVFKFQESLVQKCQLVVLNDVNGPFAAPPSLWKLSSVTWQQAASCDTNLRNFDDGLS